MCFSTLQRVEIAEMFQRDGGILPHVLGFSTLQRVEIAEIRIIFDRETKDYGFSTLQRVEIAEIERRFRSHL